MCLYMAGDLHSLHSAVVHVRMDELYKALCRCAMIFLCSVPHARCTVCRCRIVSTPPGTALLYTLYHGCPAFQTFVLSRTDLDQLV